MIDLIKTNKHGIKNMVVPANLSRLAYYILHIDMVHAMLVQHLRDCGRVAICFYL